MARRAYDNSARQEAARRTRRRILAAAHDLLVAGGYPALTVAALADRAQVSPQTIYNSVGGKAEVLKACYDATLAGDDEPLPMSERPQFRRMAEAVDAEEYLAAYASWVRTVSDRVAPIIGPLVGHGGSGDPGVAEFVATIEQERRIGTARAIAGLRELFGLPQGLALARAVDIAWTLNAPEAHDRLVRRCGWSSTAYETWLHRQLVAALAPPG